MQNWRSDIDYYELSEEYSLVKAIPEDFAIYESVYGDKTSNRFAVKHWDLRTAISLDNPFAKYDSYYWIKAGNVKIGGVLLEPNVLSRLFFIPSFTNIYEIVKLLKKLLLLWSDSEQKIYAYQIPKEQYHYFEMLGFLPDKNRRWMMRPTEIFNIKWDSTIIRKSPEKSDNAEIAKLLLESFKDGIDSQFDGLGSTYEDYLELSNDFFNNCNEDILREASTLIYNKEDHKLIGACLISYIEEWPLVHTISVNPEYRRKNLATTMLKKALSVLKNEYHVLRLFVTIGNASESVYYELGFVPGAEFKRFYLPK